MLTPTSSFLRDLETSTSTPPTAQELDRAFPTAPWHEAATSPASQPCFKEAPAFNRPPHNTHNEPHWYSKVPPRGQVHGHLPILLLTAPPGHSVPGLARHLAIILLPGHHWALLSPLQDGVSRAVTRTLLKQRSPWRASPGFQFTETPKRKCLLGLSPCGSLTSSPSPKPAFFTLFSSAFWQVPGHPGTKTYDPSPSPPSPISLAKLGNSTTAGSGQAKRALRAHTPHCCPCLVSSSWTSELKGFFCLHLLPSAQLAPFSRGPHGISCWIAHHLLSAFLAHLQVFLGVGVLSDVPVSMFSVHMGPQFCSVNSSVMG